MAIGQLQAHKQRIGCIGKMCGIFGVLNLNGWRENKFSLEEIVSTLVHRGPDCQGVWRDPNGRVALGHTRLAVQDLSEAASQPFVSASGRTVIVFNGEIYNHLELRAMMPHISWKTHSDTETLVELAEFFGSEKSVKLISGMFAAAVWDQLTCELSLFRDRFGEKPLYLAKLNEGWVFASELRAFLKIPDFKPEIDRAVLADYLQTGYVSGAKCIYLGCSKVEPGTVLTIKSRTSNITTNTYYSYEKQYLLASKQKFSGSDDKLISLTEEKLREAVSRQTISDVPVGGFLSGGVDSSIVCSLLNDTLGHNLETFSIGFSDEVYDESKFANAVAKHLGTTHHELIVSGQDAISVVPRLCQIYDEPFADSSQIATVLLSELARKHVTVAFSGDGADEIFGGYNRYQLVHRYWRKLSSIPIGVRKVVASILLNIPTDKFNYLNQMNDKKFKIADAMLSQDIDQLYLKLTSPLHDPKIWLNNFEDDLPGSLISTDRLVECSDIERMMVSDVLGYLPDDILTKVDRAAMSTSLETRIPFLDHSVAEFAASIPQNMKIRNNQNKWILRQLLYKRVPRELVDRPKMGFGVPLAAWMRGPLKDWCDALLDPIRISNQGYLNAELVSKTWNEHLSGKRNWQYRLWIILMFQSWLDGQSINEKI